MELRLRLVLTAPAGCPASSGVPVPPGYVTGQSGVVSVGVYRVMGFRLHPGISSGRHP